MASYANETKAAALNGITALLNSGQFRLLTAADAELANLGFNASAFGSATVASPSVATTAGSPPLVPDTSVTAGTIAKFELRTNAGLSRISGSVGVGPGFDIQVTSATIPGTATSVACPGGLTLSLNIS